MENIYTEFTTKMLPQIASGLTITKEYFLDLFGRYVSYLIATDTLNAVFGLVLFAGGICSLIYCYRLEEDWDTNVEKPLSFVFGIFFSIMGFSVIINNVFFLIKDFYIPEVRIYEQIKSMSNGK